MKIISHNATPLNISYGMKDGTLWQSIHIRFAEIERFITGAFKASIIMIHSGSKLRNICF